MFRDLDLGGGGLKRREELALLAGRMRVGFVIMERRGLGFGLAEQLQDCSERGILAVYDFLNFSIPAGGVRLVCEGRKEGAIPVEFLEKNGSGRSLKDGLLPLALLLQRGELAKGLGLGADRSSEKKQFSPTEIADLLEEFFLLVRVRRLKNTTGKETELAGLAVSFNRDRPPVIEAGGVLDYFFPLKKVAVFSLVSQSQWVRKGNG